MGCPAFQYSQPQHRSLPWCRAPQGRQPEPRGRQPLEKLEHINALEPPDPGKYRLTEMPPHSIQIDALASQLLLRSQGDNDFGVHVEADEHGRLAVGRIMRVSRASGRIAWFWTVTGPAEPDAGIGLVGEAEDLDTAKVEFRKAFDAVLYWCASNRGGKIRWNVPVGREPA